MSSFVLAVDATNPGEYLAVCGLIELVNRLDESATSAWSRRSGLVCEVPMAMSDACEIQTRLTEPEFAHELSTALVSRSAAPGTCWHRSITSREALGMPSEALGSSRASLVKIGRAHV